MRLTVKGILSFPSLFVPRKANESADPKYSACLLIRKDDPQVPKIKEAFETEKQNGFPSGFPVKGKSAFKDCAEEYPEDPRLANYYEIRANAKQENKPLVADLDRQQVLDPSLVFPGAVAYMAMNTYPYGTQPGATNKGVSAGLNGVMITGEEGELGRLDNKPTVEQMFADVGTAPAPSAPPVANAAPVPPTPPTPPAAPAPTAQFTMTAKAGGYTREQMHATGWTDAMLVENGYMTLPGGVTPSFS